MIQLKKGDILGHEFCGVVDQIGPGVKNIEVGKRYVASFQIACGDVRILGPLLLLRSELTRLLNDSVSSASRNLPRSVRKQTPTGP